MRTRPGSIGTNGWVERDSVLKMRKLMAKIKASDTIARSIRPPAIPPAYAIECGSQLFLVCEYVTAPSVPQHQEYLDKHFWVRQQLHVEEIE